MALLFQFGLEQRATETGTLLALGFRPGQVRRLLLWEGVALALAGGIIGAAGGVLYAKAMLRGLTTVWRGAVGTTALHYHATARTLVTGALASALVAALTIWLALRRRRGGPRASCWRKERRKVIGGWTMEHGEGAGADGWRPSREFRRWDWSARRSGGMTRHQRKHFSARERCC